MILLDGVEIQSNKFPNNELRLNEVLIKQILLNKPKWSSFYEVVFRYYSDSDLIELLLFKKYVDSFKKKLSLTMCYYPYSRMDRVKDSSAFTLKYVSSLINSMGFLRVKIIEPHSSMCVALTENSEEILFGYYIFLKSLIDINFDPEKDYICFPDEGAQKRYSDIFSDYKQCVGYKKRNFKTGRIEKLDILGVDVGDTNFNAVIVDDLCSYGGTFMLSAGKLKDVGANNISLIVTHCEESILKGDIPKSEIIKDVYTTDSIIIKTEDIPEKIRILSLESLLGYNK